jgi:hypothetical protein
VLMCLDSVVFVYVVVNSVQRSAADSGDTVTARSIGVANAMENLDSTPECTPGVILRFHSPLLDIPCSGPRRET